MNRKWERDIGGSARKREIGRERERVKEIGRESDEEAERSM